MSSGLSNVSIVEFAVAGLMVVLSVSFIAAGVRKWRDGAGKVLVGCGSLLAVLVMLLVGWVALDVFIGRQ